MQIKINSHVQDMMNSRGYNVKIYNRRRWYYLQVQTWPSVMNRDYAMGMIYRLRWHYPHARLVRVSKTLMVYNLGTVFDFIQDIHDGK